MMIQNGESVLALSIYSYIGRDIGGWVYMFISLSGKTELLGSTGE